MYPSSLIQPVNIKNFNPSKSMPNNLKNGLRGARKLPRLSDNANLESKEWISFPE